MLASSGMTFFLLATPIGETFATFFAHAGSMTRSHNYFVYLLASKPYGTLYVGVTNDILRRVFEHRDGLVDGFTKKYGVHRLVWHEHHEDIHEAIAREKRLKRWQRDWKIALIERDNPHWVDLFPALARLEGVQIELQKKPVIPAKQRVSAAPSRDPSRRAT